MLHNIDTPVVVIGGGGYIGTAVVENLLRIGYKVKIFDKFIYGTEVLTHFTKEKNLTVVQGDITDLTAVTAALHGATAVIHLAGIVGDPASALNTNVTHQVNVVGTEIVKKAAISTGISRFIFASSCSVYGEANDVATETTSLHPLSLYAETKIDSEQELLTHIPSTFHPTMLRLTTVFGHSYKPRFDLVANLFVAQAYKKGEITVFGGTQWRPFIHVRDVARAISMTLQAPIEKVSGEVFNVGDDKLHFRILDLANRVTKLSLPKKVSIHHNDADGDKRNYRVSFKKIQEVLGFTATITLDSGLQEIADNFTHNIYTFPYTDSYYSSFETTKSVLRMYR